MFVKVFEQILDSSIANNYEVRHMFEDMLKLADSTGAVDMTYQAIAARTRQPIEMVISLIGELMKPDPESRSPQHEGRRLVLLDSHRTWGWLIVNYEHYRSLRDEDDRKRYFRDKKRESRARRRQEPSGQSGQTPNQSMLGKTVKSVNSVKDCQPCPPLSTHAEGEEEAEASTSSAVSSNSTPSVERQTDEPSDPITDPAEAKRLICAKILDGKKPGRMWSSDAENRLAMMCKDEGGIPRQEINEIAAFKPFRREPLTETTLMRYWGDVAQHAAAHCKKFGGCNDGAILKKPEPPKWREFFQWKHDNPAIKLPESFSLLSREHRAEYDRDFQTFVKATAATV